MYCALRRLISWHNFLGRISYHEGCETYFISTSRHGNLRPYATHQLANNNVITLDYCESKNNSSTVHFLSNNAVAGDDFLNQDVSSDSLKSNEKVPDNVLEGKTLQLGMVHETPTSGLPKEDKVSIPSNIPMKRSRFPGETSSDQMETRSVKLKKRLKLDHKVYESNNNNNAALLKQSWPSWCSMDESNASFELNEAVTSSSNSKNLNINRKTRASRGSATDPQSLYARKRRERINERLKILQNLIPNGTKVDISTMLDEAVQYVKFLQLQIKLLSSDDLWMYAPIAYNGMDIGLDIKIPSTKSNKP